MMAISEEKNGLTMKCRGRNSPLDRQRLTKAPCLREDGSWLKVPLISTVIQRMKARKRTKARR